MKKAKEIVWIIVMLCLAYAANAGMSGSRVNFDPGYNGGYSEIAGLGSVSVNDLNGDVIVNVPLVSLPGRQLPLNIRLAFSNSKQSSQYGYYVWQNHQKEDMYGKSWDIDINGISHVFADVDKYGEGYRYSPSDHATIMADEYTKCNDVIAIISGDGSAFGRLEASGGSTSTCPAALLSFDGEGWNHPDDAAERSHGFSAFWSINPFSQASDSEKIIYYDKSGTKYYFNKIEKGYKYNGYQWDANAQHPSAWDKEVLLTKIEDRYGNTIEVKYKDVGNSRYAISNVTDALGRVVRFVYNGKYLDYIEDPIGNRVYFDIKSGNLIGIKREYDNDGNDILDTEKSMKFGYTTLDISPEYWDEINYNTPYACGRGMDDLGCFYALAMWQENRPHKYDEKSRLVMKNIKSLSGSKGKALKENKKVEFEYEDVFEHLSMPRYGCYSLFLGVVPVKTMTTKAGSEVQKITYTHAALNKDFVDKWNRHSKVTTARIGPEPDHVTLSVYKLKEYETKEVETSYRTKGAQLVSTSRIVGNNLRKTGFSEREDYLYPIDYSSGEPQVLAVGEKQTYKVKPLNFLGYGADFWQDATLLYKETMKYDKYGNVKETINPEGTKTTIKYLHEDDARYKNNEVHILNLVTETEVYNKTGNLMAKSIIEYDIDPDTGIHYDGTARNTKGTRGNPTMQKVLKANKLNNENPSECRGSIDCSSFSYNDCDNNLNCEAKQECNNVISVIDFCNGLGELYSDLGDVCTNDIYSNGWCEWVDVDYDGIPDPGGLCQTDNSANPPTSVNCANIYVVEGNGCSIDDSYNINAWGCDYDKSCVQKIGTDPYSCSNFEQTNCINYDPHGCSWFQSGGIITTSKMWYDEDYQVSEHTVQEIGNDGLDSLNYPGNPIKEKDAKGNMVTYDYENIYHAFPNKITSHPNQGKANDYHMSTTTEYNNLGQKIKETDPNGHSMSYDYTITGRLKKTIWPDNSYVEYVYNDKANEETGGPTVTTAHYIPDSDEADLEIKTYFDSFYRKVKNVQKGTKYDLVSTSEYDIQGRVVKESNSFAEYKLKNPNFERADSLEVPTIDICTNSKHIIGKGSCDCYGKICSEGSYCCLDANDRPICTPNQNECMGIPFDLGVELPNAQTTVVGDNGKIYSVAGYHTFINEKRLASYDIESDTSEYYQADYNSNDLIAEVGRKIYKIEENCNVLEFNTESKQWVPKYPDRDYSWTCKEAGITSFDGKIYVAGGINPDNLFNFLKRVLEYDIGANRWTQKADLKIAVASPRLVASSNAIYAIGGKKVKICYKGGGSGSRSTYVSVKWLQKYSPANDEWEEKKDMTLERQDHAAVYYNGKIYVIGGQHYDVTMDPADYCNEISRDSYYLDRVEVYNPEYDSWAQETALPSAKSRLSAVVIQDKIYVIGGDSTEINIYDTGGKSWSVVTTDYKVSGIHAVKVSGKIYYSTTLNQEGTLKLLEFNSDGSFLREAVDFNSVEDAIGYAMHSIIDLAVANGKVIVAANMLNSNGYFEDDYFIRFDLSTGAYEDSLNKITDSAGVERNLVMIENMKLDKNGDILTMIRGNKGLFDIKTKVLKIDTNNLDSKNGLIKEYGSEGAGWECSSGFCPENRFRTSSLGHEDGYLLYNPDTDIVTVGEKITDEEEARPKMHFFSSDSSYIRSLNSTEIGLISSGNVENKDGFMSPMNISKFYKIVQDGPYIYASGKEGDVFEGKLVVFTPEEFAIVKEMEIEKPDFYVRNSRIYLQKPSLNKVSSEVVELVKESPKYDVWETENWDERKDVTAHVWFDRNEGSKLRVNVART